MKQRMPVILVLLAVLITPVDCGTLDSTSTVALYNDEGVWLDGVIATEHMLDWIGIDWQEIDAEQLNGWGLDGFRIFWLPGGWAPDYSRKIQESGRQALLEFVEGGGAYVGVCAGAYYAASIVTWAGESYPYPLGLFHGAAVGPEIYPWPRYGMAELELNLEHPINAGRIHRAEAWILLYGGGHFIANGEQKTEIVARYRATGQPAIITFTHGQGVVLLLGVHPEIEENDARDGTDFAQWLDDQGSDWPLMQAALGWILNRR